MRVSTFCAAVVAGLSVSAVAMADPAAAVTPAQLMHSPFITSADGRQIGNVLEVEKGADGAPTDVKVIYETRIVRIPVSTLTPGPRGLVTSLKKSDVAKLD